MEAARALSKARPAGHDAPSLARAEPTFRRSNRDLSGRDEAKLEFGRRYFATYYAPILSQSGLLPDQLAQVRALLIEDALIGDDVTDVVDESGQMFAPAERAELMSWEHGRIDAQLRAVAGDRICSEIDAARTRLTQSQ